MKQNYIVIGVLCIIGYSFFLFFAINHHSVDFPSEKMKDMPTPRQEVGVAVLDNKAYVIGGFDLDYQDSNIVEIYDIADDSWSEGASLPVSLHHPGVVAADDTLYVIGGFVTRNSKFIPLDTVYYLSDRTWKRGPKMPTARGALSLVVHNDVIYVIGGADEETSVTTVEAFDIKTRRWEEKQPMEVARDHISVLLFEDEIYALGGRDAHDCYQNILYCLDNPSIENTAFVEKYNIENDVWTSQEEIILPRSGMSSALDDGLLYLFSGEDSSHVFDELEVYDPSTKKRELYSTDLTPRHAAASFSHDGYFYVIGGGVEKGYGPTGITERIKLR